MSMTAVERFLVALLRLLLGVGVALALASVIAFGNLLAAAYFALGAAIASACLAARAVLR